MMRGLILLACLLGVSAITIEKPKKKAAKKDTKAVEAKDTKKETETVEVTDVDSGAEKVEKKEKKVGDLTQAERANLPKFFQRSEFSARDQDGFSWGTYRWGLDSPGLRGHPAKAKDMKEAQFVIMCCLEDKTKDRFLNLPKRTAERPYLVKTLKGSNSTKQVLIEREDILVMNYDLRDSMDKSSEPLRGITIAPHNYYNGKKMKVDQPRNFFVTFQGRKTSKLRHELHDSFNNHRLYKLFKNISVETVMDRLWNVKQQTGDHHYNLKMNSTYVLLPKGDDRWSLRFSETLGAGAIPVVLADGLTLPYENIIDWSKAAIRLPNGYAQRADEIMKRLPTDETTIMSMRKAVYDINRKYFATPEVRADAMLLEASAMVKKGGKYDPIWRPEVAEPWLEHDRKGATEASKAIAAPLAKSFVPGPFPTLMYKTDKEIKMGAKGAATKVAATNTTKAAKGADKNQTKKPTLIKRK